MCYILPAIQDRDEDSRKELILLSCSQAACWGAEVSSVCTSPVKQEEITM